MAFQITPVDVRKLAACGLCLLWLATQGFAQDVPGGGRGDRGFGGPGMFGGPPGGFGGRGGRGGRGGGGLLGELSDESTRSEIQVTAEQQQKIDALGEAQRNNRDQFSDIFQRMQAAQSEEERNAVRDEMRKRFEEVRKQAEGQLKEILSPDQFKRLDQIRLHKEGPGVFARDESLALEFGLTDAQKEQFAKLGEERMQARMALGREMSDEDRKKFDEEWSQKYLAALTPEQRTKWTERLGPPPVNAPPGAATAVPLVPGTPAVPPSRPRPVIIEQVPEGARPVVSFGAAGGAAPGVPPSGDISTAQGQAATEKKLSFNFRYAPWIDVLKLFAEEAGLSLDLNALPPGTFNYYDQAQYTPTEALDILNGYLLPKGYCLVRRDDFLVCINIDDPIPPSIVPNISASELDQRGRNELLTVIFPLEGVDVEQVAAEVNDIKGPQGKVVGLKSTNSILVTDIGANLRRIRDLLADVTARGGPNDVIFKAYQIHYVAVADVEQIIRSLLGLGSTVSNVSAATEDRRRDPRSTPSAPLPASSTSTRLTTDQRTNQLLVTATLGQHQLVEQALKTIDVDGDASQFSLASQRPFLKVYTVTSSDAREVTKTIDALMPGVVVNEDGRNGKVHIMATPEQHRQVETLIAQMDGLGGSQQMSVIPLTSLDPVSVTATIRSMFSRDGSAAPTVEADLYGRQIMVRGTADQLAQVRTLLTQLGEDGSGRRAGQNDSRIRAVPLGGRDPEELLPLLQRMWGANNETPIRIINPQQRGATRPTTAPRQEPEPSKPKLETRLRAPQRSPVRESGYRILNVAQENSLETQPESSPAAPSSGTQPDINDLLDQFLGPPEPAERPSAPAPAAPRSSPPAAPAQPGADVNITVMGDELIISSSDPKKLDELQALVEKTMQVLPPRVTWTVFTLQAADATEAANMLKLLLPGASVSATSTGSSGTFLGSLSSGAASLGSSLMDMTGLGTLGTPQHLQIIPDVRLNALFVSGPPAQVREVEEMLKVLDSTGLGGDSLRDKVSRMIAIEHADAQEVYNMVKEVYKNYIEPPRTNDNSNNPFAMLAAGGRSRGGNEQAATPAAKLAIGVDTNTSHLIVWADEPLYREIEALVQGLDKAAQDARRTVRVVTLENTNSTVIQGALGSLMPRVKVSVTGSRQSTTSSTSTTPSANSNTSSSTSTSPPPSGGPSPDQMRQFFEQRMRERMQGGGDGGSPFGGGFRGGFGPGGFGGGSDRGGDRGGGDRRGR